MTTALYAGCSPSEAASPTLVSEAPDARTVAGDAAGEPDAAGCVGASCGLPEGCGDGVCEGEESATTCCVDCKCTNGFQCISNQCVVAPSCGDGACQPGQGENCESCVDCACTGGEVCSPDGECCTQKCDESTICGPDGCGTSCGACADGKLCSGGQCVGESICGDGFCDQPHGESCANCSADCTCPTGTQCLPNGTCCEPTCSGKHCGTDGCTGACGSCLDGALCVDNLCIIQEGCGNLDCEPDEGEGCDSCPQDCGCEAEEICTGAGDCCLASCAGKACGGDGCGGSCGACPAKQGCVEGQCVDSAYCGNGVCESKASEHCGSCSSDCACATGFVCSGDKCCQPSCGGKVCGEDGCGGSCGDCGDNDTCSAQGKCESSDSYPKIVFDPASPQAGSGLVVSVLDTTPWAYVGLAGAGPCGAVETSWIGVEQVQSGVWRWQYGAKPKSHGSHTFTFTRDSGAAVVIAQTVQVGGEGDCGGDLVCPAAGAPCTDIYPSVQVCEATGQSTTVTCHKTGTCSGKGDGTKCSWGPGSWCDDACGGPPPGEGPPANGFGIGLVGPGSPAQWDLAKELAGDGGHLLIILPGVQKWTNAPSADWIAAVQGAYDRNLVPVVRIGPPWGQLLIRNDSDDPAHKNYKSLAQAYKSVVSGLPLRPGWPLYVQVHNEPNLCNEWACDGGGSLDGATRAAEYAAFFRDVADALHAIGDPRIKVSLGALAPGGVTSCDCCGNGQCGFSPGATGLDYLNQMQAAVPDIFDRLDWLASHSYPAKGTGWGFFVPYGEAQTGLKYYTQELATIGKPGLPVILTETGWRTKGPDGGPALSDQDVASYTKSAFQDVWLPDSSVIGVTPFVLQDAFWGDQEGFGWVSTSGSKKPVFDTIKAYRCTLGLGPC